MDEISRMEKILRGDPIEPITRLEIFCAMAAGTWSGDTLTPASRLEYFLSQISGGGVTLSTFISRPSIYSGEQHYSYPNFEQFDAPEGVAFDKIWNSDEYLSWAGMSSNVKHYCSSWRYSTYGFYHMDFESMVCGPSFNTFGQHLFDGCNALKDLVLLKDSVISLTSTNAFTGTPFASGGAGGTLWVPNDLISSYQAATNWSTILGYANNQIKAIEGSVWE